jgi:histidinol-phosphate aminotransferase
VSRFVARPAAPVAALKAYDPGHDLPALRARAAPSSLAELGSNENPLGPAPAVLEALRTLPATEVFRYPDPLGLALRRALAARLGVDPAMIALGNGSHELLMLLAQCFAAPGDEVVFSEFGFAVFPIGAAAVGADAVRVPALPRGGAAPRGHDLPALAAAVGPRARLVFVANPNNPTGTWFTREALRRFLAAIDPAVPVVVDEAYHEYVDDPAVGSAVELLGEFPNMVVTRTFSKGHGLAGLRVGYAVGDAAIIDVINRLRESFNVNALALLLARLALDDPGHLDRVRAYNRDARSRLAAGLAARNLFLHPSMTNFVLVDFERPAAPIEAKWLSRGVVVRPMGGYGLPTCLRISVGAPEENERLLATLDEALS